MGKSTASAFLASLGAAIHDSDEAVHRIYRGSEACAALARRFGASVIGETGVDRAALSKLLVELPPDEKTQAFSDLSEIVHPLVQRDRDEFIQTTAEQGSAWLCVLDVPLLFESGLYEEVDAVVVVTAPPEVQRARCMARPGMSEAKFESILAKQTDDTFRKQHCDFLVDSSTGMPSFRGHLARVVEDLATQERGHEHRSWCPQFEAWSRCGTAQAIKAVTFDLDDTIWPVMPALHRASAVVCQVLSEALEAEVTPEALRSTMTAAKAATPGIDHDLTAQREEGIRALLRAHGVGVDVAESIVLRAMEAFLKARSGVAGDLFGDSLRTLSALRQQGLVIGALTNGNFNLQLCPELSDYFDFCVTAGESGAMKPAVAPFLAAAAHAQTSLAEMVHVGDSVESDLNGALHCGMRAVLLDRSAAFGAQIANITPDSSRWGVVSTLDEAAELISGWGSSTTESKI